jgi:hypothetical protein
MLKCSKGVIFFADLFANLASRFALLFAFLFVTLFVTLFAIFFGTQYAAARGNQQKNSSAYHQVGPAFYSVRTNANAPNSEIYQAEPGEIVSGTQQDKKGLFSDVATDRFGREVRLSFVPGVSSKKAYPIKKNKPLSKTGYIDLPDNEVTTIYSEPGKTWTDCQRNKVCMAWPHNQSELTIVESRMMEIIDPYTRQPRWQNFYRVKYRYQPRGHNVIKQGEGWISSAFVSTTPVRVPVPPPPPPAPAPANKNALCPSTQKPGVQSSLVEIAILQRPINEHAIDAVAQAIAPHAGKCLLQPPNLTPDFPNSSSPFDEIMMPHYKALTVPNVSLPNGSRLSREQLMSIDALARTIYGEMASCWGRGAHYLTSVAAIVRNRTELVTNQHPRRELFVRRPSSEKPTMVQVISDPKQFSAWNPRIGENPNHSLRHVMCPPANESQPHWTGHRPGKMEQDIWKRSIRIATEAVIDSQGFKNRTPQINQYYYTSGLGKFMSGFTRVIPSVEGMRLSRASCIEIWQRPGHP